MTQINTDGLFVGGIAWADFGSYHRANVKIGRITHRTAGGRITVEFAGGSKHNFNAKGNIIGKYSHGIYPSLINRETFDRLAIKQAEHNRARHAAVCIAKADEIPVTTANKDQLLRALEFAIAAVEAL